MRRFRWIALTSLSSLLAACGGASGGIAPIPAAPVAPTSFAPSPAPTSGYELVATAPLPPTPATTRGSYGTIAESFVGGRLVEHADGAVTIAVDPAAKTYTLTLPTTGLPVSTATFVYGAGTANPETGIAGTYVPRIQLGQAQTYIERLSDGSTGRSVVISPTVGWFSAEIASAGRPTIFESLGLFNVGQNAGGNHYTSLGSWGLFEAGSSVGASGFFVFGERTGVGDVPITGTATYRVSQDTGYYNDCIGVSDCFGIRSLGVDFGNRTISATASYAESNSWYGDNPPTTSPAPLPVLGRYSSNSLLSGTGSIATSGAFSIALSGTGTRVLTRTDLAPVADVVRPLTGIIDGAFFGPQAGELGGVYRLDVLAGPAGNTSTLAGAFSATRN